MDLVKSWLGQALRATGAAIVVPVAILAALSLTALGGAGLGGLDSLTQVVSGPQVAGSNLSVDDGDAEISDAVTQIAASDPVAPAAGNTPGTAGTPGIGGGGGTNPAPGTDPGGRGAPPDGTAPRPDDDGGGGGGGGGQTPPPSTPPPSTPPPPEPPDPGVVGGLGETVKGVTEGTPVAPTVEDVVDTLVEACGRLGCP